jgi:hypothetical protein
VPSCIFLIGPRNKKTRKKKSFSSKKYPSTVPNHKLAFLMKIITQNLNQTARQRVAPQPRPWSACSGQSKRLEEAGGSGGVWVIISIRKASL